MSKIYQNLRLVLRYSSSTPSFFVISFDGGALGLAKWCWSRESSCILSATSEPVTAVGYPQKLWKTWKNKRRPTHCCWFILTVTWIIQAIPNGSKPCCGAFSTVEINESLHRTKHVLHCYSGWQMPKQTGKCSLETRIKKNGASAIRNQTYNFPWSLQPAKVLCMNLSLCVESDPRSAWEPILGHPPVLPASQFNPFQQCWFLSMSARLKRIAISLQREYKV